MENVERGAEARSAARCRTLPPGLTACLWSANVKENIRREYPLYVHMPRDDILQLRFDSHSMRLAKRLRVDGRVATTTGPSPGTSTPDTSPRIDLYLHDLRPSVARQNADFSSGRFKVLARPQVPGAPIGQSSQIPGPPQRRGTRTKNHYRLLSPDR